MIRAAPREIYTSAVQNGIWRSGLEIVVDMEAIVDDGSFISGQTTIMRYVGVVQHWHQHHGDSAGQARELGNLVPLRCSLDLRSMMKPILKHTHVGQWRDNQQCCHLETGKILAICNG